MKKNIHPDTREILFRDVVTGDMFLARAVMDSVEKQLWTDGKEYPVVNVEISSASHPVFTGTQVAAAPHSRAEEFARKYGRARLH